MTGNPLVHMGPLSLVVLFVTGLAWGAMPIDRSRLRGRYGEARVALAGPAMNIGLASVGLIAAVLWLRMTGNLPDDNTTAKRGFDLLWMFTFLNVLLAIFNLLPVPPLDGSHIMANLSKGYNDLIHSDRFHALSFLPFIGAFLLARYLVEPIMGVTLQIISDLSGVGLRLVEVY